MFGSKRKKAIKLLVGITNGAMDSFDKTLALTCIIKGRKQAPKLGDRYLAILLGFMDAAAQAGEIDMETTRDALRELLNRVGNDGPEMFDRMMRISNDPKYYEWQMRGGRALMAGTNAANQSGPMMQLAEAYLE